MIVPISASPLVLAATGITSPPPATAGRGATADVLDSAAFSTTGPGPGANDDARGCDVLDSGFDMIDGESRRRKD